MATNLPRANTKPPIQTGSDPCGCKKAWRSDVGLCDRKGCPNWPWDEGPDRVPEDLSSEGCMWKRRKLKDPRCPDLPGCIPSGITSSPSFGYPSQSRCNPPTDSCSGKWPPPVKDGFTESEQYQYGTMARRCQEWRACRTTACNRYKSCLNFCGEPTNTSGSGTQGI